MGAGELLIGVIFVIILWGNITGKFDFLHRVDHSDAAKMARNIKVWDEARKTVPRESEPHDPPLG